jgi:type IV secretory pathway TrbF-like protein
VKNDSKRVWVIADPERSSLAWKQSQAEVLPLIVLVDSVGLIQRYANLDIHLVTTVEGELSKQSD